MFVSQAYAEQGGILEQNLLTGLLPFVLIFFIMYFLIIRPQRLNMKNRAGMLSSIRRGDTIVTGGGLIGKVTRLLNDEELELDLGSSVKVLVVRSMIASVRSRGEPAANQNEK